MNNIAVLGGGYAGVLTVKHLLKQTGKDTQITLYDKNSYHTLLTELHEVAAGRVDEDSVRISYDTLFPSSMKRMQFVQDCIQSVDYKACQLQSSKAQYTYDYLVLANGSRPNYWSVPGAEEFSFPLWSYQDAVTLRQHILQQFRLAMQQPDEIKQKALLHFVVVGAGFTGIEMAGELAEWLPILCRKFHINHSLTKVTVIDQLPTILPMLPPSLIAKAEKDLRQLGVVIVTPAKIAKVSAECLELADGSSILCHTVIWNAGVQGQEIAGEAEQDGVYQGRGRLVVSQNLQLEQQSNVFVAGDRIFMIPEGHQRPVPQMVENCEHSAPLLAHNIAAAIRGKAMKPYKPTFHGMMVSIGSRRGVAYLGAKEQKTAIANSFLALTIKHFINLLYLVQVGGWIRIYSYLLHEFFHVPNRRNILGGHFSRCTPNFWLLPLRLFIGAKWFMEGYEKIQVWLEKGANTFILFPQAFFISANTDATTAASATAENWGKPLPCPEFISHLSATIATKMFYAENYLGASLTGFGQLAQTGLIFAELLIGLMLFGGFFTAPVAIASILMGLMIWTSGYAPMEMLWYWFGALALIGGAGSVFSMDYYLYPPLKKLWKKLPFVRNYKLYNE